MPRDLIVAANVNESKAICTLIEAFNLKGICSGFQFYAISSAFKNLQLVLVKEVKTTFGIGPNAFKK